MKKSVFTLFLLALIAFGINAQTIRRVNNNLGISGVNVYTTIQAAHDAATAGDIIYIEPSSSSTPSYGDLIATKQVDIIGNGYLMDKNSNTPFDNRTPQIGNLTFNKGSANSSLTGINITGAMAINCNNILVRRCWTSGISMGANGTSPTTYGSYVTITQCLIRGAIYGSNSDPSGDNCTISNNIIAGSPTQVVISGLNNSTFIYNTFMSLNYGQYGGQFASVTGSVISNNIFDSRNYTYSSSIFSSDVGTTYSNNVCIGISALPAGNGNINAASPTNFYVNADPLANNGTIGDSVFQLGVGAVGGSIGAFSGNFPYRLSGNPPIPVITNFTTTGVGNSSTPLNVSVTVRGNN